MCVCEGGWRERETVQWICTFMYIHNYVCRGRCTHTSKHIMEVTSQYWMPSSRMFHLRFYNGVSSLYLSVVHLVRVTGCHAVVILLSGSSQCWGYRLVQRSPGFQLVAQNSDWYPQVRNQTRYPLNHLYCCAQQFISTWHSLGSVGGDRT